MSTLIWPEQVVGDDRELLERVRGRDPATIGEIYDRHHRDLCAFASRLLGDTQAAEDLVHDVFIVLPGVIHRLEVGKSLRGFLLGITANRARHYVRAAARRRKMTERLANEPAQAQDDPEQRTHDKRLADILARILDKLPLDQRVAFVLCDIEARESPEVAAILGIPEGTVRTRLYYARQKVRALLAKGGAR
jgi:RNA polymerase sigma-70 factor (ECF subfamily)